MTERPPFTIPTMEDVRRGWVDVPADTGSTVSECADDDVCCCGAKPLPPAGPEQRAGYQVLPFVERFLDTPAGPVPVVQTTLSFRDRGQTWLARLGAIRDAYAIAPGLYAVGSPDSDAPVLVTANFKLTTDSVRTELDGVDAWLLVLDTRGVNVWCAAGKRTFSTDEVVRRVAAAGLESVVNHRTLVLPQLGAPGVAAREVKRRTGFSVTWGPVRAADLPAWLAARQAGDEPDPAMREVTFTLAERMAVTPVELWNTRNHALWAIPLAFVLSGIGSDVFSLSAAWSRGLVLLAALAAGLLSGSVVAPALLPWLPGRSFSLKGVWAGVPGALACSLIPGGLSVTERSAAALLVLAVSSCQAMIFTGSTPYTSPSGVEWEMRRFMPLQAAAAALVAGLWLWAGFIPGTGA